MNDDVKDTGEVEAFDLNNHDRIETKPLGHPLAEGLANLAMQLGALETECQIASGVSLRASSGELYATLKPILKGLRKLHYGLGGTIQAIEGWLDE